MRRGSAAESEAIVAVTVLVVAERAAQQAGGLGEDADGTGGERVDSGGPEGAAGLHEVAAQRGEVRQAPHARENGPGAPFACLDGAGQGVHPGAEVVGASRGGHEFPQLAARPGRGGQRVAAGLSLEPAEGMAVELAEVGRTALEGERSLLEPAAVERLGQAVPRRRRIVVDAGQGVLEIEARYGDGSVQARTLGELPLCVEIAVAHGGQLVRQLVVTLGDLSTRFEDGSLKASAGRARGGIGGAAGSRSSGFLLAMKVVARSAAARSTSRSRTGS